MRLIARAIAPILAAAAIALAGGAPAVLADSENAAQPWSLDLRAEWCFDDSPGYLYCFDVKGKAQFVDNKAGSSVTITERNHTVVSKDGVVVGEDTTVSLLRGVYQEDGTVVTQERVHTRATFGDESCQYSSIYRIVDFELVLDHVRSTCG
jgi:hypothetical protein